MVLSIGLMVFLNLPVILLFNRSGQVLGVPVLYVFLFSCWLSSIIVTYIIIKKNA